MGKSSMTWTNWGSAFWLVVTGQVAPGTYLLTLIPAGTSVYGKDATNAPRKVLRSSPWAHHSIVGPTRTNSNKGVLGV
jgi:hypothetical protein